MTGLRRRGERSERGAAWLCFHLLAQIADNGVRTIIVRNGNRFAGDRGSVGIAISPLHVARLLTLISTDGCFGPTARTCSLLLVDIEQHVLAVSNTSSLMPLTVWFFRKPRRGMLNE